MATAARTIPVSIRRGLARVDRRVRALGAVRGLGVSACALGAGAIIGEAADFFLALPNPVRWGMWLAWMALAAGLLALLVVRPLVRRLRVADLAAVAELAQPGREEHFISTVELLDDRVKPHGSEALIDALAIEAEARARGLNFTSALSSQSAMPLAVGGRSGRRSGDPAADAQARSVRRPGGPVLRALERCGAGGAADDLGEAGRYGGGDRLGFDGTGRGPFPARGSLAVVGLDRVEERGRPVVPHPADARPDRLHVREDVLAHDPQPGVVGVVPGQKWRRRQPGLSGAGGGAAVGERAFGGRGASILHALAVGKAERPEPDQRL